ncbi:DUF2059 domain-containing protein [Pseudoduganella violaceinigra]|uniref:DUF2059 domain-containing protein n=1 Tax=Pseudoduganella violaceinigra TaxID=246602 RepID=UPI0004199398|nr:DUF2059 domain-containing protein [Pseudoduganella violaceinigra]
MKKTVFAAVALASAALAHAAPPSEAAIRELMDATNARANMTASVQNLSKALPQILRMRAEAAARNNPKLTDEQRKAELANAERRMPALTAAMQKDFNDPKLVDELYNQMVPLYARHFTDDDIKALTAFYRSPTGKKSLQVMPMLMGESAQAAQKLMQEHAKRIIESTK